MSNDSGQNRKRIKRRDSSLKNREFRKLL